MEQLVEIKHYLQWMLRSCPLPQATFLFFPSFCSHSANHFWQLLLKVYLNEQWWGPLSCQRGPWAGWILLKVFPYKSSPQVPFNKPSPTPTVVTSKIVLAISPDLWTWATLNPSLCISDLDKSSFPSSGNTLLRVVLLFHGCRVRLLGFKPHWCYLLNNPSQSHLLPLTLHLQMAKVT